MNLNLIIAVSLHINSFIKKKKIVQQYPVLRYHHHFVAGEVEPARLTWTGEPTERAWEQPAAQENKTINQVLSLNGPCSFQHKLC